MDKLKKVLSGQDDDTTVLQVVNEASTLSWGTRVKGFVACFVLGVVCSVLGVCLLWLPKIGLILFIVFYTFGNITSLLRVRYLGDLVTWRPFCSSDPLRIRTMFLMGPLKQLKRMCDKTRVVATILLLTFLGLTLCSAFWWKNNGLALLFCILQFLAFAWYGLSYIPFARDAMIKLFSLCVK